MNLAHTKWSLLKPHRYAALKDYKIIKEYIDWVKYDFYSSIKFVTILGESKIGFPLYRDLNNLLLKTIKRIPDAERNIAYVFYRYPHLITSYLALNEDENLTFYQAILERKVYEES